ncbi:MAG: NAD(P)-dependent dehydrogenase (short-subunit alcohol dehydrogenase family) [Parasphingorhabdus sp.]|jgi:NAD(P)-dependent dehydrogenase (short-subunit alcohol dehydrogenase family)
MIKSGKGGSIINIASIMVYRQRQCLAAYFASKAGVNHLTQVLALEWASHYIRVNAIAPVYIHSEMTGGFSRQRKGGSND